MKNKALYEHLQGRFTGLNLRPGLSPQFFNLSNFSTALYLAEPLITIKEKTYKVTTPEEIDVVLRSAITRSARFIKTNTTQEAIKLVLFALGFELDNTQSWGSPTHTFGFTVYDGHVQFDRAYEYPVKFKHDEKLVSNLITNLKVFFNKLLREDFEISPNDPYTYKLRDGVLYKQEAPKLSDLEIV